MATSQTVNDDADAPAEPYHEQVPFMGTSKRFYGFISGTGAGKTFAGIYRLVANATELNIGHMGAIIVPDKGMFVDNVKPIMEQFGLMDRWEYNSVYTKEPGLITEHGDRILILSADNQRQIGRIKGKNLAYVWMDEEAEIDSRAREIAQQRLRVGTYPNLFITTTPDGYNHTYDFFKGDVNPTEYTHGKGTILETDDRLAITGVPPEANPVIRDEDIASMRKNLSEQIVAQEIEGQFVQFGAGVYQRDMFQFIDPEDLQDTNYQTIIAIDPAATVDAQRAESQDSDYWAVVVGQAHPRHNRLFITDVARQRGLTLQQGCEWIGQIAGTAPDAKVVAEANQSQAWLIDELKNYGVHAQGHTSTREKEARLLDLTIPIANSVIQFVDWPDVERPYADLISEALSFPDGSHDDTVDALALCAEYAPVRMGATIMGANPWSEEGEDDEGDPRYA